MKLRVQLFGSPQVLLEGQPVQLVRRKSRAVLYYIAAQEQRVTRSQLLALFWPDLPRPAAQQTLRTTLHGLRSVLGEGLQVDGEYVFLAESAHVDVRLFESSASRPVGDLAELQRALEAYGGDFLDGFYLGDSQGFDDWVTIERERYRRMAIRGLAALAAAYEARQEYSQALSSLERALAFDQLQEDLQRACIRLLYLAGDRPGAIRRYDELRKLLDEEMGVPPMAETRALYDAIVTDRMPAAPARTFAAAVSETLAASADRLPFVGRSSEFELLKRLALGNRFILIEGEAGIGKTRLVEEFIRSSRALPLVGRGRELEQALPYHPWIEALRSLLNRAEWPSLAKTIQADLAPVWFNEVNRLLPELSGAPQEAGAADESRLWEGLRQFLLILATRNSLVIFMDDLQWMDTSTLGLLSYLARQMAGAQIAFIGTARRFYPNSPAVKNAALVAFVQANLREDRLTRVALDRLPEGAVQEIARRLSPASNGPLAEWLLRLSEGNPYILSEVVREAYARQILDAQGVLDAQALASTALLPQSVYDLIQSRLDRLSDAARRMLDVAVTAGREFEFEIVVRAVGLSETAALDALAELKAAGLVIPLSATRFMFDHSLTMEVAYREVGELRHQLLHRRIADVMAVVYQDRLGEMSGWLARHYAEGGAFEQAAPYAFQAGQQAAGLAGWSEAVAFYEIALKGSVSPGDYVRRISILAALGNVYEQAGQYVQASEVLRQAMDLVSHHPDSPVRPDQVQLALVRSLLPQARFTEAIAIAQKIRKTGQAKSELVVELTWGTALSIEGRDLQAAREHLQAAEDLWRSCEKNDPLTLSQIKFELGSVAAQQGDLKQAVAYYREALDAALETAAGKGAVPDFALERTILAYNNLAYHLLLLGDNQAEGYARLGLALAQEKGILGLQTYLYSTSGEIALAGGDLDLAEQHFNHGLELARRFSMRERVAGLTANLGLVAARRGQKELAIRRFSQAQELADSLGTLHLGAQIRLWLAPLLPFAEARQRLAEARLTAETSGRQRLLDEIVRLEKQIEAKRDESP